MSGEVFTQQQNRHCHPSAGTPAAYGQVLAVANNPHPRLAAVASSPHLPQAYGRQERHQGLFKRREKKPLLVGGLHTYIYIVDLEKGNQRIMKT